MLKTKLSLQTPLLSGTLLWSFLWEEEKVDYSLCSTQPEMLDKIHRDQTGIVSEQSSSSFILLLAFLQEGRGLSVHSCVFNQELDSPKTLNKCILIDLRNSHCNLQFNSFCRCLLNKTLKSGNKQQGPTV